MGTAIENKVKLYFGNIKVLTKDKLVAELRKDFPTWTNNTINTNLYRLKKNQVLNTLTRGVYTLEHRKNFQPRADAKLKKIASRIRRNYPFVDYCVWNTLWLNDFMLHQPFKGITVVEVEKSAVEAVFALLSVDFKYVYLNPDRVLFERYINSKEEVIIVKHLNSEAPTITDHHIVFPTLEKLLVDMLIDENLFSAQQGELDYIFKTAYKKFTINESKMKRYAARRNREEELQKRIKTTLAK
ncbi:DUF6577 family protein [Flavobacterium sp.]|uniref:DUF6577 family protein n=1 Tax=Flavobacterium sp. TaxID=239 RepID=UPI0026060FFB|nr:DUF6577 family protein [Flavobacterium sp.]